MAFDKSRPVSKRGSIIQGVVVSDRSKRTVVVQRDLVTYVPKYKRYARKISKISAHNPDEIGAKMGDVVEIAECRRISKTKAWIVTKIAQRGEGHIKPGQVKAHDEAQRAHMKKHGGSTSERKYEKGQSAHSESSGTAAQKNAIGAPGAEEDENLQ